jgi:hypothetical protein
MTCRMNEEGPGSAADGFKAAPLPGALGGSGYR